MLEDTEMHHLADETQWPLKSRPAIVPSVLRTNSVNSVDQEEMCSDSRESESILDLDDCGMDVDDDIDVILGRRKSGESSKTDRDKAKKRPKIQIEPSDLELFCLGRTMGTQDYLGQRVVQVI